LIIYKASAITYSCAEKDIKDLSIEDLRNNKPHLAKAELDKYKVETTRYFQGYFSKMNQYIIGISGGKRKILPELKMDSEIAIPKASVGVKATKQANQRQENRINSGSLVNQSPVFPGGQQALDRYLADNLKYSDKIKSNAVSGKAVVSFVIETDGSITAIKIIRSLCNECDEEIVRVLKAAPKWKPAVYEGKIVRVSQYLTVPFNI
jgi:TonB family protein